jgi:riboflavin kinase / FMN adenylyltransferase
VNVLRGLPGILRPSATPTPCALAIGNFDGVHRGHQALLARVVEKARAQHLAATVLTFEPHPREFFAPHQAPARVSNQRDKLEALAACGIDQVVVAHFNARFAVQTPEEFAKDILHQGLNTHWMLVGDDFRYGARRLGDVTSLRQAGYRLGFEVEQMHTIADNDTRISSSVIRRALASGDLQRAQHLLGHPYRISGHVLHGQKLGRELGFPTLNLRVNDRRGLRTPALSGIFIVKVHGLTEHALPAVASLGLRPTVDDSGRWLLEVHLLNYSGNAYGHLVQVEFLHKLRDEAKYDSITALTEAIAADVQAAHAWFETSHPILSPNAV